MVPGAGLEPARHCWRGILSPLCLPIPPPGLEFHYSLTGVNKCSYRRFISLETSLASARDEVRPGDA